MSKLPNHVPVLIVGAGPIGLACAISSQRRGLDTLVIDQGPIAAAIAKYPVGMTFFTTPERLEIGGHPLPTTGLKTTREEALAYYRGVARSEDLTIRSYSRLADASRLGDEWHCTIVTNTGPQVVRTGKLVLATGYLDHPNMLGVQGESLPHVSHWFEEAHALTGQDVVIVGGKNSAIEAALLAFRVGARVTLIHRGAKLKPAVKYWLKPDFENRVAAGEISAHFESVVDSIDATGVCIRNLQSAAEMKLPADRVFLLTGYHPDFELLARLGVDLEPGTRRATIDADTLESNVAGLHLAGSVASGTKTSEIFIENGRFDGEKIFGDALSREKADLLYTCKPRAVGE